jgi:hypothetical protein
MLPFLIGDVKKLWWLPSWPGVSAKNIAVAGLSSCIKTYKTRYGMS